jgi:hypothetical protein
MKLPGDAANEFGTEGRSRPEGLISDGGFEPILLGGAVDAVIVAFF